MTLRRTTIKPGPALGASCADKARVYQRSWLRASKEMESMIYNVAANWTWSFAIIYVYYELNDLHLRRTGYCDIVKACRNNGAVVNNIHRLDTKLLLVLFIIATIFCGLQETLLVDLNHTESAGIGNINSPVKDVVERAISYYTVEIADLVCCGHFLI
jgi:hypothetical protein